MSDNAPAPRNIRVIAQEVRKDWPNMYFAAVPYWEAMLSLNTMADNIGADSAYVIVQYFLSNARTWRGPVAKRIKAELNAMLKMST